MLSLKQSMIPRVYALIYDTWNRLFPLLFYLLCNDLTLVISCNCIDSLNMHLLHKIVSISNYQTSIPVLLQRTLDPPNSGVVKDALDMLVDMRALEKTPTRDRYEPTFYGQLLASFSLSFDASVLILKFGDIGMLREGILLGVLMDTQPLPILRPFGDEHLVFSY